MDNDEQLTSVHSAIQNAVLASKQSGTKDTQVIVRIDSTMKAKVAFICEKNGVSVSDFLRQCCAGLIRDYTGEPALE